MLRHPASAGRIFVATRSSSSIIRLGSSRRNTTAVWLTPRRAYSPSQSTTAGAPSASTFSLSSKRIETSIVFHARPAASASARSSASEARSSSGVFDIACQPSPRATTRRRAAVVLPPTQIGGGGFFPRLGPQPTSPTPQKPPPQGGAPSAPPRLNKPSAPPAARPPPPKTPPPR